MPTIWQVAVPSPESLPVPPSAVVRVRRLLAPALVVATALLTALALLAAAARPATAAAPPRAADVAASVRELDRQVNRVGDELRRRTAAYEAAQLRSARATRRQFDVRAELEQQHAAVERAQSSFDELARAAYKGAVPPLVTALLTGDPRTVADLAYVQRSVERAGAERHSQLLADARRRELTEQELAQTEVARRRALAAKQSEQAQLQSLLRAADVLAAELATTADRLVQVRAAERAAAQARAAEARAAAAEARAAAVRDATARAEAARRASRQAVPPPPLGVETMPTGDGGQCLPPSPYGEANGFLSQEGLCPLAADGRHRLRTDAARAFDRLNEAYLAAFGTPMCITDSYRSYAAQVDVFKRKPSLAAVPGRSQHGWGLAVDLCGGVQTFGTPAHEWLRANAERFGWEHPRWARSGGSKPEAWHWEYVGG